MGGGGWSQIKFWEDTWFGFVPLVVQFWDLYCVCNEKTKTITEIWVQRNRGYIFVGHSWIR
jgi:hypothetical protein